jgi:G protein-coupled receptor 158
MAMIITLVFGVWMTYSVRNTPSAFNESKWIAFALYNWVVIGVVLNAISNFAVSDPDIIFIMEALTAIITQTGVVGLLYVPKIIEIKAGRGQNNETFSSAQSTTSGSHGSTSASSHVSVTAVDNLSKKVEELNGQIKNRDALIEKLQKEVKDLREAAGVKNA